MGDLEAAIGFYSKLFATAPAKRRDGYANFAIENPPLKLVLFEQPGKGGTIPSPASHPDRCPRS